MIMLVLITVTIQTFDPAQTTSFFISEIVAVGNSVAASGTQLTSAAQSKTGRIARTVAFITEVRAVEPAVTLASHVNTRTTSAAKLLLIACCTSHA